MRSLPRLMFVLYDEPFETPSQVFSDSIRCRNPLKLSPDGAMVTQNECNKRYQCGQARYVQPSPVASSNGSQVASKLSGKYFQAIMTDDRFEPCGSYCNQHPENSLSMENPYGDRERHDRSDSRDRGGFRYTEERERDRHGRRYRDDDYQGGSRRANDGYLANRDQRGHGHYPSRAGYKRHGYDDGYQMRNEATQRFDERETGWHRQNDGGGQQYDRGRHQDYYGRNEQEYRGNGGGYDHCYEKDRGSYDTHHSRKDYMYDRGDERNDGWGGGDRGNVSHSHGWDQRDGGRYDRNGGGYSPRCRGRKNYYHEEADYNRHGRHDDMVIDRYARNGKPSGGRGYGDRDRSPRGRGVNERWEERSAAGAQSPGARFDSDPLLMGEYMFGYAVLPPQVWEDIPTDHGASESDDGEITNDRPPSGMRRKLDNLDLEDGPEHVKRARHE